ncbi:hypothetical protein FS837_000368 [Tulasnella sp. UAMH 9824]|nr:hypothetical protein FS837_000368 [Tulasnella sp. UAMH 9824]
MRRNRQAQGSKPHSAQNNTSACKADSKKLEAEETSSMAILGNVIDGIGSLALSAVGASIVGAEEVQNQPGRTIEAAPRLLFDLLPDELVVAILTEVVSSYIEPLNQHKAPSRLLRISKRIHAIAIGTPHLWEIIAVEGDLDPERLWPYLLRAKTFNIYIYGRFEREIHSLLDQLRTLSILDDYWKSLHIRASNHRITRALLSQLTSIDYPNLDTLIIRSNRPASISTFLDCPKLETLVIKGTHLDWRRLTVNSLRRLEVAFRQLTDAVWSSFEDILRSNAAQLQHLFIRLEETVQGRPTYSPIQLGSLDTLRIVDMTGEIVLPLLSSLEIPRLRVLQLSGNGSEWPAWDLKKEDFKLVEELNLHDLICVEEVLVSLVSGLPALRKVSLWTEGIRPSQVRSLIEPNSERNIAWVVRLAAEDCSINEETPEADVEAAQKVLEWLATNSEFSIKDFRYDTNSELTWQRLPAVTQWRLVEDYEWGKQIWLPPLHI